MSTHVPDFSSFTNELLKLSGLTNADAGVLLEKMAKPLRYEDAAEAAQRLEALEASKPTPAEIGRGAIAGAAAGTLGGITTSLIGGGAAQDFGKALKDAKPGWRGKVTALGKGALTMGKHIGAGAAGTAAAVTAMPLIKRKLEQEAEKGRLRQYLDEHEHSKLHKRAFVITPEVAHDLMQEVREELEGVKLASEDLDELYKEAILRRLIPGARKVVTVGGETVDFTQRGGGYRGLGQHIEELGNLWRRKKGVSPEDLKAIGADKGVAGHVFGEALHDAGHHMRDASTVGILANPAGKFVGGAIQGAARGTGQELQRMAGPAAQVGAGGIKGAVGRGLERHAKTIGTVGEIGTGAATATALGHAVSPMAHGLGEVAKHTGVYKPMKYAIGKAGLNVVKDTAATALEEGMTAAPTLFRRMAGGAAS